MIRLTPSVRRCRLSLAIGTSTLACGLFFPTASHAQCTPDPTQENGTTNCSGTNTNGLVVNTFNTQVVAAQGATLNPGAAMAAITVSSSYDVLTIDGMVDGAGKAGIAVIAGPPTSAPCDPYAFASVSYCTPGSSMTIYPSASATINVAAGATVTGSQALSVSRDPSNPNGYVSVSMDNAGTLTGTAGPALVAPVPVGGFAGFLSITNEATGFVGGMSGGISAVNNAGTVDGGGNAAIATSISGAYIANTGRIVSSGQAATLSGTGALYVTNAGGAILGGGGTAINTSGPLSLTNAGTINGSVISTAAAGQDSVIDTRQGMINGDLTLGAGNDTLLATFDSATGRISSITGAIDGGAGTDTLSIAVSSDATFGAVALPTNFELLGVDLSNNATITLSPAFASTGGIALSGYGSVVNMANLSTNGPAVVATPTGSVLSFTNQASITANLSATSQFAVSSPTELINIGTITAIGGAGAQAASTLTNSGTIAATGTAATVAYGTLANSGVIGSTGGIGAAINSSYYYAASTNSGTISGATTGVNLSGTLTNSGTITGGATGVALGYSGTLINAAGGTVTGGTGVGNVGYSVRVVNAGTINGDVNLASTSGFDSSDDIFVDAGGTVNGAVSLGGGDDQLVVNLGTDSSRPFAGATGGVDAGTGYNTLRYRVKADAAAALTLPTSFEALAYELDNNAQLTLTAPTPIITAIGLTGNGTVTLNGSIATSDHTLIDATIPTADQLTLGVAGPAQALSIVNDGMLSLTIGAQGYSYNQLYAINAGTADVTNNGTIATSNAAGSYFPAIAILNGHNVTNNGTITLAGGGVGISDAQNVVNAGTITDTPGSGAVGVAYFDTLQNSGTIQVDGTAVQSAFYQAGSIVNSGLIESRQATAVQLGGYGATLTNETTGTISGVTAVDVSSGGAIINRGAIVGDISSYQYSYGNTAYLADGGTVTGNVTFGAASDLFVETGTGTGVSGIVDGGDGEDTFGHVLNSSGIVALDGEANVINFEDALVQAAGIGTVAMITATNPFAGRVYIGGDGSVINQATINGMVTTGIPYSGAILPTYDYAVAAFTNQGTIAGGFFGATQRFANSGTIGGDMLEDSAILISQSSALEFTNSGTIANDGSQLTVNLDTQDEIAIANDGKITGGGVYAAINTSSAGPAASSSVMATPSIAMTNTGTITASGTAVSLSINNYAGLLPSSVTLDNSGMIETGTAGGTAVSIGINDAVTDGSVGKSSVTVTNSGTIRANAGGIAPQPGNPYFPSSTVPASAIGVYGDGVAHIANAGTGLIEATGALSTAIITNGMALDLTNAGTIRGGTGTTLADDDYLGVQNGTTYLAGAIQSYGDTADKIVNTGTIIGSISLGAGNDTVENRGTIAGDVFLGAGDDSFLEQASATVTGTVDGGEGLNSLIIDASGGGTVNGDQFVNFQRFNQVGNGNVIYTGNFHSDTIGVTGGSLTVAAGQTLGSDGATTITGSDAAETVVNNGTITGSVALGGGNDLLVNNGAISGSVSLGDGDDQFVEGVGSSVAGTVDGGAGNDLYTVVLAGNRTGIGQRTGFERLALQGSGTLSLVLDQNFQSIALGGNSLNLSLGGHSVGTVTGTDAAETLVVDGDIANVSLGGGDDTLALGTTHAAGSYDGGTGNNTLRFTATAPVSLSGTATNFGTVLLAGNALTVTGTLGSPGTTLSFGAGDQSLTVANGGTLAGAVDLGDGNDNFWLAAGGTLAGTINGGAGINTATVELAGSRTLAAGTLIGFETLAAEGTGQLTLSGAQAFSTVTSDTDIVVAAGGSLTANQVQFGAGDNRFTIAGGFNGSVDGGAGNDILVVSGGSDGAPVMFGNISNVETYSQSAGSAQISGTAAFTGLGLTGGRLVGQAGSIITASQIQVSQGATFGSAGTVNGNVTIAGTLSPGASLGTMTVNGNVTLASGSTSLFELSSAVSDKLMVNGSVAIGAGSTLQLVEVGTLRPGTAYTLISATGGITGGYTTVLKPADLFGFVVQRGNEIDLLGKFLDSGGFGPQVSRSIAYTNTTLEAQASTSTLFDALPALLTSTGASNPQAFARLTPEAYASATQMGVDNALVLVDAARGPSFAATGEGAHVYTLASTLGQWHQLNEDRSAGTSAARSQGYGFLSGIGYGDTNWSLGAFGGYINNRQTVGALAARTKANGAVAGVQGRLHTASGFGFSAAIIYDGSRATTTRVLPVGSARGRYGLHSWISDMKASYEIALPRDWAVTPQLGVTYLRTSRGGVSETGGSPFALTVSHDRHVAGFTDGAVSFGRSAASAARFRPFVSFGVRYQIEGAHTDALAGYAGGGLGLDAPGAPRARLVGTASGGIDYRLESGLDFFANAASQTGSDDHQESASAGVRFRF
ncbi:autotransporter outer membrane beta-barrel domain-containing protein [Sphingomonas abietis]|uniref:Autotransporter outer membrane beta-barrel domain-containing protein n=1 Tax=Sphingomonas abietis TaxID=3012344 RepID=A0ABY7NMG1_9SPHN|nr:autotransporter outer membrane beta-barrel domain-containing protein [Sphingomonas abietis]WBO20706.1 autotransporter outer membrane beta-barrel domain-containing protein [Sphingomonas abietis]